MLREGEKSLCVDKILANSLSLCLSFNLFYMPIFFSSQSPLPSLLHPLIFGSAVGCVGRLMVEEGDSTRFGELSDGGGSV